MIPFDPAWRQPGDPLYADRAEGESDHYGSGAWVREHAFDIHSVHDRDCLCQRVNHDGGDEWGAPLSPAWRWAPDLPVPLWSGAGEPVDTLLPEPAVTR